MSLVGLIIITVTGLSNSKMLIPKIVETVSMLDKINLLNLESSRHKDNGAENEYDKTQIILLEKQFIKICRDIQARECKKFFEDLLYVQSRIKRESHLITDAIKKFYLRGCLNGTRVVYFDTENQLCCDGVFNKSTGNEECCEGEIIDNKNQFCCNGNIQNRTEFSSCCGTYTFDTRLQICCQGKLYSQYKGESCCGSGIYNKNKEKCCFDSHIFKADLGDACCGTNIYNSTTHICCDGVIQQAFGKNNKNGDCCKDKSYHSNCHKCENNTILPIYNETSTLCCDGRIRNKKYGNNTVCCGRQAIHPEKHFCDNNERKLATLPSLADNDLQTSTLSFSESMPNNHDIAETAAINFKDTWETIIISAGGVLSAGFISVLLICKYRKKICSGRSKRSKQHTNGGYSQVVTEESFYISNTNYTSYTFNQNQSETITVPINNAERLRNDNTLLFNSVENQNEIDENLLCKISKLGSMKIPIENEIGFYSKESFTQTCPEKASNCRTIFGKPFQQSFVLGEFNATVEMASSDVKMTLPASILRYRKFEVHCSSYTSRAQLRIKLGLNNDRALASPVVEYALTGLGQLADYAVVILPFIGNPDHLEVRKFESDEGLNTVTKSVKVPEQTKNNENKDLFYIVKDSYVYVYTKSFSGFYCTTMRHRSLRLRCFLFGSYKRFCNPLRYEVRVVSYVADELMKFADYKERMLTNENAEGRVLKKEMLLKVPTELTEKDILQFSITPTESHFNQWIHKLHPGDIQPVYDEVQRVELYHIAEKCNECEHCHLPEHDMPHSIEWYMTNVQGVTPYYIFQCIVDIDVIKAVNESKTKNRIVIDELQLRQEDRQNNEVSFDERNVQGVKEYLSSGLSTSERESILGSLATKYNSPGRSVEEVFFKLHEKLTPRYILEAVATVLKKKKMFQQLDCLQSYGYLPHTLVSTDIQPVCEEGTTIAHTDEVNGTNPNLFADFRQINDLQHVESRNHHNDQEQEFPEQPTCTSDVLRLAADERVRRELSQTAVTLSVDDRINKGTDKVLEVHGELSTPVKKSESKHGLSYVPVQENASLDNTTLKERVRNEN